MSTDFVLASYPYVEKFFLGFAYMVSISYTLLFFSRIHKTANKLFPREKGKRVRHDTQETTTPPRDFDQDYAPQKRNIIPLFHFTPSQGKISHLMKTIFPPTLLISGIGVLCCTQPSLFLLGLPLVVGQWLWTVSYLFHSVQEFPRKKQLYIRILGYLALIPFSYLCFFLVPCLFPLLALFLFLNP